MSGFGDSRLVLRDLNNKQNESERGEAGRVALVEFPEAESGVGCAREASYQKSKVLSKVQGRSAGNVQARHTADDLTILRGLDVWLLLKCGS